MSSSSFNQQQPYYYSPSAPPQPDPDQPRIAYPYQQPITNSYADNTRPIPPYAQFQSLSSFGSGHGYGYGSYPYQSNQQQVYGGSLFPVGTHPDVIRSFQMVDTNQNGYIEDMELQEALLRSYHKFSMRTLRLLIFLFKNHGESFSRIGPKEFTEIWTCLGQWREIFERFDRDRSGKIDAMELRDALYSLGYALPPSVLQVLISKYDDGRGGKWELDFDSFVECGMIVKGLTEKFKEKDQQYTGSATLTYDTFMSMIIPFVVAE